MIHDSRCDLAVAENDDDQRENVAIHPDAKDPHFCLQIVRHVVECAAG